MHVLDLLLHNLIRRADRALLGSRILRDEIEAIRHRLPKTGPDPAKTHS